MTVGTLIKHLELQALKGGTHARLGNNARKAIRDLIMKQRQANRVEQPESNHRSLPISTKPNSKKPLVIPALTLPAGNKTVQMNYLKKQAFTWPPVQELKSLRKKVVFSEGDLDSKVMFVGEAPGFDDELRGLPFHGKAGQKLDAIFKAMGLSREQVYLTNLCKYRPSVPRQTVNNRSPNVDEIQSCLPFLMQELQIIRPRCIVALGLTSAQFFTAQPNRSIEELRGAWHSYRETPLRVTFHPSYLLKNANNLKEKRKLWEDMLEIMSFIELPINEKQRSFFKK